MYLKLFLILFLISQIDLTSSNLIGKNDLDLIEQIKIEKLEKIVIDLINSNEKSANSSNQLELNSTYQSTNQSNLIKITKLLNWYSNKLDNKTDCESNNKIKIFKHGIKIDNSTDNLNVTLDNCMCKQSDKIIHLIKIQINNLKNLIKIFENNHKLNDYMKYVKILLFSTTPDELYHISIISLNDQKVILDVSDILSNSNNSSSIYHNYNKFENCHIFNQYIFDHYQKSGQFNYIGELNTSVLDDNSIMADSNCQVSSSVYFYLFIFCFIVLLILIACFIYDCYHKKS